MKKVNSMNSASTAYESNCSDFNSKSYKNRYRNQKNSENSSDDEFSSSDDEDPIVKFRIGDKFTKKAL